jgi:hypothetical protein
VITVKGKCARMISSNGEPLALTKLEFSGHGQSVEVTFQQSWKIDEVCAEASHFYVYSRSEDTFQDKVDYHLECKPYLTRLKLASTQEFPEEELIAFFAAAKKSLKLSNYQIEWIISSCRRKFSSHKNEEILKAYSYELNLPEGTSPNWGVW